MKAVIAHEYGPPESFVLADLPIPQAGPGQIQVRITAASINPMDLRFAAGDFRAYAEASFPLTLGTDFAGTVTEVGAGVTAYGKGDEVFGTATPRALKAMGGASRPSLGTGTLAEYAVFEADTPLIARRPATLDPVDAAALPTAGLVTRALLAAADPQPGQTVLVIGASGGIGTTLLPQLAHTHIIATGKPGDDLPADEVIGYDDEYPTGLDIVFNLVLPDDRLRETDGRLFTITLPAPRGTLVMASDGRMSDVIGLTPTIGGRYRLDDGVRALTDFARRHRRGKLVVSPRLP